MQAEIHAQGVVGCGRPLIPDHDLLRPIGKGSYGEVWLARNVMGAYRAVKIIHRDRFESERPYQREFEGIRSFEPISRSHPSQLSILHVGRGSDYFYYIMELADDQARGQEIDPGNYFPKTLRNELNVRGRIPFESALEIGLSLATALEHLHRSGLVHRDVKPSNIVFVHGIPKLADIGLVAEIDATLSVVGTEGFIPPEGPGTPQADIYSFGKVLYEMATGRDRQDYPELPTDLRNFADAQQVIELNEIIVRACAPDPKNRYPAAAELRADLELLHTGKSLARVRAVERGLARARRAAAVVATVALVAVGAMLYQSHQTQRFQKLAAANSTLASQNASFAEEKRKGLVELQVANGNEAAEERDLSRALLWYAAALKNVGTDSPREMVHRTRVASVFENHPRLRHQFVLSGVAFHCVFSPDGFRVATLAEDARDPDVVAISIFDLQNNRLLLDIRPKRTRRLEELSFSPDGERLVLRRGDTVMANCRVFDAVSGSQILTRNSEGSELELLDTPDGRFGVFRVGSNEVRIAEIGSSRAVSPPLTNELQIADVWMAPGGKVLCLTLETRDPAEYHIQIVDGSNGRALGPAIRIKQSFAYGAPEFFNHFLLSRNAQRLAISVREALEETGWKVKVFDVSSGTEISLDAIRGGYDSFVTAPNGSRWIVTRPPDSKTTAFYDIDSEEHFSVAYQHSSRFQEFAFSPDSFLLTAGERLFSTGDGKEFGFRLRQKHWAHGCAFDRSGWLLAVAGADGLLRIWDLANSPPPDQIIRSRNSIWDVCFSPDGQKLALSDSYDSIGELLDMRSGQRVGPPTAMAMMLPDIAFSPTGEHFVMSGRGLGKIGGNIGGQGALLRSGEASSSVFYLQTNRGGLHAAAVFSPKRDKLLTAGTDRNVYLWSTRTGELLAEMDSGDDDPMYRKAATFSADGERIATASGYRSVRLWRSSDAQLISALPAEPAVRYQTVTFSPDGQLLFVGGNDRAVHVWDLREERWLPERLEHDASLIGIHFSADGRKILTRGGGTEVKVWDAVARKLAIPPLRHLENIVAAEFSPDSQRILTASRDGTARLWDVASGEPLCLPFDHGEPVHAARFRPGTSQMITAGEDGRACVRSLRTCDYSVEDITEIAELLACAALEPNGTFRFLNPEQLNELYQRQKAKHPEVFQSDPRAQAEWHETIAMRARNAHNWTAVITNLDAAVSLSPLMTDTPTADPVFETRGVALAELGNLEKSLAEYEKAVALAPNKIRIWRDLLTLVAVSDPKKYSETCTRCWNHFQAADFSDVFRRDLNLVMASAFLFASNNIPADTLVHLTSEEAASLHESHQPWRRLHHGRALYRAGEFPDAIAELQRARELMRAANHLQSEIYIGGMWLAISLDQAGRHADAGKAYSETLRDWEAFIRHPEARKENNPSWGDRLIFALAAKEAKSQLDVGD